MFYCMAALIVLLFYIAQQMQTVFLGYTVDELRTRIEELKNDNNSLKTEIYSELNVFNLSRWAAGHPELKVPGTGNVIFMKENTPQE